MINLTTKLYTNVLRNPQIYSFRLYKPLFTEASDKRRVLSTATTPVLPPPVVHYDIDSISLRAAEPSNIFTELLSSDTECVIVGIDPDANGAIATVRWTPPINTDNSSCHSVVDILATAHTEVFDMPTETWQLTSREKKRPSPEGFLEILNSIVGTNPEARIRAAVEFTTPGPLSGKYAWYDSGFASGLISGLFMSQNMRYERISASAWKRQLGLTKAGKEGSLTLARQLFPQAADVYLKRKKDHGRAEALLITAWALGVRAAPRIGN